MTFLDVRRAAERRQGIYWLDRASQINKTCSTVGVGLPSNVTAGSRRHRHARHILFFKEGSKPRIRVEQGGFAVLCALSNGIGRYNRRPKAFVPFSPLLCCRNESIFGSPSLPKPNCRQQPTKRRLNSHPASTWSESMERSECSLHWLV